LKDRLLSSTSALRQSEISVWEDEVVACEHTLCLQQSNDIKNVKLDVQCHNCDVKENIWFCLTCGNKGCGRKNFDGTGGNNHGIDHYETTGHPVVCKLGTITPEGEADVFCYLCGEMRKDPELQAHLATFNVNIKTQSKTEKSLAEMVHSLLIINTGA
jgi:ubiquitin carboxyl-terminal hydrolase 5/13